MSSSFFPSQLYIYILLHEHNVPSTMTLEQNKISPSNIQIYQLKFTIKIIRN